MAADWPAHSLGNVRRRSWRTTIAKGGPSRLREGDGFTRRPRSGGIGELRGGEHRRVAVRNRLMRRRHLPFRHLHWHRRRRPDDFGHRGFVLAAGGGEEDEKDERALHARAERIAAAA